MKWMIALRIQGTKYCNVYAMVLGSQHFEEAGGAHSTANAHRDDYMSGATPLAFNERVSDQPRARHAIGMTDRDRAAIDVQ